MVTIRTYRKGDKNHLIRREGDEMGGGEFDEENGPTWTILIDGTPATLFGFQYACEGVYDLWGVGTEHIRGHGVFVVKAIRKNLVLASDVLELHRIQATCRTDRPEYARFLEVLGFQKEGTLRQMAPNKQDLFMYSMVEI